MTSLALATMGLTSPTGVSVNISTEFVRPGGREGEELIGIGEVVKIGESTAPSRTLQYLTTHDTPLGTVSTNSTWKSVRTGV